MTRALIGAADAPALLAFYRREDTPGPFRVFNQDDEVRVVADRSS